jgi:hypothetical protein
MLSIYQDFLDAVVNKRWRRRFVPVVQQGRSGTSKTYALSPDYYAQVGAVSRWEPQPRGYAVWRSSYLWHHWGVSRLRACACSCVWPVAVSGALIDQ